MPLDEYTRKRDFGRTPEPPALSRGHSGGRRFCVQRHDATRLHYDLRLEIEGVLKSWAVPKGPTLDPARRTLAVHVEDHPLDYRDFEGVIPEGSYGAGSVMLWDRGTFEPIGEADPAEQYRGGNLKFRLYGDKLRGEFALVRMKRRDGRGNQWLLIKKRDEAAVPGWDVEAYARSVLTGRSQQEIAEGIEPGPPDFAAAPELAKLPHAKRAPMPGFIEPMKATPAERPPAGGPWVYEVKWDGIRALCYLEDGSMRLYSRRGNPATQQYPELGVLPHYVKARTAILDGEIAVLDEKGRASFSLIQPRIAAADPHAVAHLARSTPVVYFPFDLLYLDGFDLRNVPLEERKRVLRKILLPSARIRYSEHFAVDGQRMLEAAREQGIEGIVAKHPTSPYESRRSRYWLKIKIVNEQEFVIAGFTRGERSHFSSLLLGYYEAGLLVYAGKVGTGFDQRLLAALRRQLDSLVTGICPFDTTPDAGLPVTWVRPELVCTVRFSEWTRDARLRGPVFIGLRPDVNPADCIREPAIAPAGALQPAPIRPLLLPPPEPGKQSRNEFVTIEGKTLKFTNLDKVFYPEEGYTKRDVINYYDQVADLILPHLKDRPLSLKRYPNGIHEKFFFQKNIPENYPDWLRIEPIFSEHRGAPIRYVIADDRPTLLFLANLACIDQNPWLSRVGSIDYPDFLLIDLDAQECPFDRVVEAALHARQVLDAAGLRGYPKTTGGDGMHIYVPLKPRYTFQEVRSFAEILAQITVDREPDLFTTPRTVAKRRTGRVYFDYLQNAGAKTVAAPYVLRAYPGAPVATPLEWREVTADLDPRQFHIRNAMERFARTGDLFRPVLEDLQEIGPAIARLRDAPP
ncbi:MAG: DNA ligase D [Bryobacteraceae bacterium]